MGINGVQTFTFELRLLPEEVERYAELEELRRQTVFGEDYELATYGASERASLEKASELAVIIGRLCVGPQAESFNGIYHRELRLPDAESGRTIGLMWNPAGTRGGFGSTEQDAAVASIRDTASGVQKINKSFLHLQKGRYKYSEMIYVDRETGMPIVQKTLYPHRRSSMPGMSASRPASDNDVNGMIQLLQPYIENDRATAFAETNLKKPLYVEIGYGLDPAALRGNRQFTTIAYLGIDQAVGDYENPHGAYVEAVRASSIRFNKKVASERPDENIQFSIGDAEHLGLPDGSVQELYMSNVINAPVDENTRHDILAEAHRVISRNGELVVRVNWHQDEWPESGMVTLLCAHGFAVVRSVTSTDAEYNRLEDQYGRPNEVSAPPGYYIIAVPQK